MAIVQDAFYIPEDIATALIFSLMFIEKSPPGMRLSQKAMAVTRQSVG